jgi:hypothetical protein
VNEAFVITIIQFLDDKQNNSHAFAVVASYQLSGESAKQNN